MKGSQVYKKRIRLMLTVMLAFVLAASVISVFAEDGAVISSGAESAESEAAEESEPTKVSEQDTVPDQNEKNSEQSGGPEQAANGTGQEDGEAGQDTPVLKAPMLRAAGGNSVEYGSRVFGNSRQFWSTDGNYIGCCCQAGTEPGASGTATMSRAANTSLVAKIAYYYGYQKDWIRDSKTISGFQVHTNAARFMYMVQMSQQGTDAWLRWATSSNFGSRVKDDAVARFKDAQKLSITVPDNFECYICTPTNGRQKFILYKYNEVITPGTETMQKVSGNTEITG